MDQLASGIPLRAPKGNPVALPGTWAGSSASCTRRMTEYQLRMREGTGNTR